MSNVIARSDATPRSAGAVAGVIRRSMAGALHQYTDKRGRSVRLGAVLDAELRADTQAVAEALM